MIISSRRFLSPAMLLVASSVVMGQGQGTSTTRSAPRKEIAARVTGFVPVAEPKTHTGKCPFTVRFQSLIKVNHGPTKVEYQWERSDGATGPKQTITIAGNNQYVHDTWELGGAGEHTTVWERVHVLSPNDMASGKAMARLSCSK